MGFFYKNREASMGEASLYTNREGAWTINDGNVGRSMPGFRPQFAWRPTIR